MDKEENQYSGDEDGQTVDAESQSYEVLKEDAGNAGTYDETQVKAQIGQGICFFPLSGGGVVCVQGIVGRTFDGLK